MKEDLYAKRGGNIYLIGAPARISENPVELRAGGVDGFQLSFFDFAPDLAYFGETILPLMKQAVLRLDAD